MATERLGVDRCTLVALCRTVHQGALDAPAAGEIRPLLRRGSPA
jgi:hypothetical protein